MRKDYLEYKVLEILFISAAIILFPASELIKKIGGAISEPKGNRRRSTISYQDGKTSLTKELVSMVNMYTSLRLG